MRNINIEDLSNEWFKKDGIKKNAFRSKTEEDGQSTNCNVNIIYERDSANRLITGDQLKKSKKKSKRTGGTDKKPKGTAYCFSGGKQWSFLSDPHNFIYLLSSSRFFERVAKELCKFGEFFNRNLRY